MLELTQWWRQSGLDSKPWMILGKGPSFGQHARVDLTQFHLLSLNHAVQKLSVDVAHLIDLDVVEDCGDALLTNCRWLLMPRYPHVKFQASPQPLEAHVARSSVLQRLAEEGRLVWYNLSTAQPADGSPVIEARYFSAEAAIDILGTLGVRKIRSVGIDGGRGYGTEFAELERKTMLANGHTTFNNQFAEIKRLCSRHGIDYAPIVEPLQIFCGADESQRVAARVLEFSIKQHATLPVNFQPLHDVQLPQPKDPANRPRTGFSFFRFAIPQLCDHRGRALYLDADMQVFRDPSTLWEIPFGEQKVLCTNQPEPPDAWKTAKHFHPGRQMSVMLLDCSRLDWDPTEIVRGLDDGRYTYEQLMFDLCVVRPDEIADRVPPEWNCLEWFDAERSHLVHYTVVPTQPWKNDENPLRQVWEDCYRQAVAAGAVSAEEVLHGIQAGHLKPSLANLFTASEQQAALARPYVSWGTTIKPVPLNHPPVTTRRRFKKFIRGTFEILQRVLSKPPKPHNLPLYK